MKRLFVFLLALVLCCSILPWIPMEAGAATERRDVINVNNITGEDIVAQAKVYLGIPYTTKGSDYKYRTGFGSTMMFDCSGFVYRVCREVGLASSYKNSTMGVTDDKGKPLEGKDAAGNYYITAHTQNQRYYGNQLTDEVKAYKENKDYSGFKAGDLLFFNYSGGSSVDHVAIYTTGGSVIHVTSSKGVVQTKLSQKGWPNSSINKTLGSFLIDASRLVGNNQQSSQQDSYLGKCTSYPSHCTVKTTKTTYIKSLPCSESTDANSKNVETASKGSTYEAIGLYKNTAGNLWYKVTAKNGSVGYMYAGDTTFVSFDTSDLLHPGVTAPTSHTAGKSYVLTGKVSSTYNQLKEVTVSILDKNGNSVTGYTDTASGNSYTLKGSTIDNKTKFGSLSVGTYTFVVRVKYRSYYAKSATAFVINQSSVDIYKATFNVVSASCSHSYSYKTTKNPTTSATGTLTGTCSKCSGTKTVTLPKLTTTDYTYKVTKSPTCLTTGTGRYTWKTTTYGTFYFDVSIAAKGHSYANATCTKPKTCSTCGATTGSALGHSYNSGTVTKAATCTTEGVKTYTCTVCKVTKTEKISAKGHSYANATCTKPKTCSTCGATTGSALGHSYDNGTVTKAATCTTEGVKTYTCTACKATKTEKISAKGHSYANATCTKPKTCSTCGATTGSALGHNYNSGVITKPATCKDTGITTYTCTKCGDNRNDTIDKLTTHTYDDACDSTCSICGKTRTVSHQYSTSWNTDESSHWHVCSLCGNVKDKVMHVPGASATENAPQTCTACGYIITPALGHTHKFSAEMSSDRDGHWYTCEGCEEQKDYAFHTWENACDTTCNVCNATREVGHDLAQEWSMDETAHWHACEVCGIKDAAETHVPGMEATADTAQTCVVCGYEIVPALGVQGTTPPVTQPTTQPATQPSAGNTAPTEAGKEEKQETERDSFEWIPVLVLVVATVLISTTVTVIIMKRKRT